MKAAVDSVSLLKAISCVDYGYVTEKHYVSAYVELHDGSVEIGVSILLGCYDIVLSASTVADTGKKSEKVRVHLYDLLQAAKRLAKTSKRGTATIAMCGGDNPSLSISSLGIRADVRCCVDYGESLRSHYHVDGPRTEVSRESLTPALQMLASLKPAGDGFAESLGAVGGYAFATDRYTLCASRCDLPDGALPRSVVSRLLAADWPSVRVAMSDTGYITGELCASTSLQDISVHYSWREGHVDSGKACDPMRDILGGSAQKLVSKLRTARPWTCAGAALRQALNECKSFCTKGEAVLFSPHEAGVHLLRYDLADTKTATASVLDSTNACETLCLNEWPFPSRIALPRKQIAAAVKKAETVTFRVLGDTAALEVDGSPVMQLMIERVCPFLDRVSI